MAYPSERSVHRRPVPYLGGAAIYLASIAAVLITGPQDRATKQALIFGGLFILIIGIIDDLYNLKPWQKVLGQLGSALIVVGLGVDISFLTDPFTGTIRFTGMLAIPLTVLWVISFENVINLSDGLDGLAAGISGITALVTVFASVRAGAPSVGLAAAAIAGSVFGFLPYNWHPASIFMGDAGAMYLGLALAVLSVQGLVKSTLAMAVLAPILALLVPISDAAFAILRRRSLGRPVSRRDSDHIHHRLLELGLGQKKAVVAIYIVTAAFGVLGLFSTFLPVSGSGPLAGLAIICVLLVAHKMGILSIPARKRKQDSQTKNS
ncbi:MAG: undecaprenyl/decaprenyl-phosphate alpha-N-acetylglucosaminyl 1-phosphate transferase [Firmicutes bacterium]|jgi:UDP-GlcNAc:undecaprenyl-phosphate GlcNAc-1-phosphate transferase|nr:undecaprenyl/decaprenyl-phosphate alpha-N-acetylglucosaminyl 1-phosphate transferase [Candidatus Fermentithermobacillaceae bacterium]